MATKADVIDLAFEELRISGLTLEASAEESRSALRQLENMASEMAAVNQCVEYNFTMNPEASDVLGVERKYCGPMALKLAYRMAASFGKQLSADFAARLSHANAFIAGQSLMVNCTQFPSDHPLGSGSFRYRRWRRTFPNPEYPSTECENVDAGKALPLHDQEDEAINMVPSEVLGH